MKALRAPLDVRSAARRGKSCRRAVAVYPLVGIVEPAHHPNGERKRVFRQSAKHREFRCFEIVKIHDVKMSRNRTCAVQILRKRFQPRRRVAVPFAESGNVRVVNQAHIFEFAAEVFGSAFCRLAQFGGSDAAVAHGGERGVKFLRKPRRTGGAGIETEIAAVFLYDFGKQQDGALRRKTLFNARAYRLFRKTRERRDAHVEHRRHPQRFDDSALGRRRELVGHDDNVLPAVGQTTFELSEDAVVGVVGGVGQDDSHKRSIPRSRRFFNITRDYARKRFPCRVSCRTLHSRAPLRHVRGGTDAAPSRCNLSHLRQIRCPTRAFRL